MKGLNVAEGQAVKLGDVLAVGDKTRILNWASYSQLAASGISANLCSGLLW